MTIHSSKINLVLLTDCLADLAGGAEMEIDSDIGRIEPQVGRPAEDRAVGRRIEQPEPPDLLPAISPEKNSDRTQATDKYVSHRI